MSYRIEIGESLAAAFARIAGEEIDLAASELERDDHGEAVHDARKALKRLRAMLRSLRIAFPRTLFRAENRRFTKAGRELSPLRDIHVQLRTMGKLKAAKGPVGKRVRHHLLREQTSIARQVPELRKKVGRMLEVCRDRLASWPWQQAAADKLTAGLKRIYKQGREARKAARKSPTAIHLHEWRKKTKLLVYGLELLHRFGPRKLRRMIQCSEELSETLGDDHDLFMVWSALHKEYRSKPARDFGPLARRVSLKRAKLQKRAFKLGRKVYREKSRSFEKRLDRYLRHAQKKAK